MSNRPCLTVGNLRKLLERWPDDTEVTLPGCVTFAFVESIGPGGVAIRALEPLDHDAKRRDKDLVAVFRKAVGTDRPRNALGEVVRPEPTPGMVRAWS